MGMNFTQQLADCALQHDSNQAGETAWWLKHLHTKQAHESCIPRTQVNKVWQLSCNSSLRRQRPGRQGELAKETGHISKLRLGLRHPASKNKMEEQVERIPDVSLGLCWYMPACVWAYIHTWEPIHTGPHIHMGTHTREPTHTWKYTHTHLGTHTHTYTKKFKFLFFYLCMRWLPMDTRGRQQVP